LQTAASRQTRPALALVVVFVAVLAWVETIGPLPGDHALYRYFIVHPLPSGWYALVQFFQNLAEPIMALATVAALAAIAWRRRGRREAMLIIAASAVVVLVALLKGLIGVTPPWHEVNRDTISANFPSGHVAYATAVFGMVIHLARGPRDRDVRLVCWALIVGMGPARLVAHAHLLSDVVAGYAVGALWLLGLVALSRR
jgi:membrane-associated phospholipid phosphatase